ncbi:MAG: hypothetical protein Q4D21_09875 [Phascolarctobacterium sp.]|nr:hypothetical protein [Phascolarctobacterium sp.]
MNKTFLATCLAISLCSCGYAEQFTNSKSDRYNSGFEISDEKSVITEAKDIKDTRTAEEKKNKAPMPINMSAEHCDYDSVSGDFHASGNVVLTQGVEKLLTTEAFGNLKTGDVYLEKGGTLIEKTSKSNGQWVHYNFNNKTGEIKEITGVSLKDEYKAPHAIVTPEKIILDEGGTSSRCPAKKHPPCLSVTAKTIEIYPKEKMVAKDVKVYVKGKHIYSRDIWVNTFSENTTSIMPRAGYDSKDNGTYIKLDVAQPIGDSVMARAQLPIYSKAGYKPNYSVHYSNKNFSLSYMHGWEEEDDRWYKKQNTWKFTYHPHHFIDGLPLTYSGYFEYGLWNKKFRESDHQKNLYGPKSWHKEYAVYLNHDPIHLFNSQKNALNLTIGKKWVNESYTQETRSTNMYYVTFSQKISPKFTAWTGYYHEKVMSDKNKYFDLHQPDMSREWRMGIKYSPDASNTFSIVNRYDTGEGNQYETDYVWSHKFCCWSLDLIYEDEQHEGDRSWRVHWYFYNL